MTEKAKPKTTVIHAAGVSVEIKEAVDRLAEAAGVTASVAVEEILRKGLGMSDPQETAVLRLRRMLNDVHAGGENG